MLPIKDRNRPFTAPVFTYLLILLNIAVFAYQLSIPEEELMFFFREYGIVPARMTGALRGEASIVSAIIIPLFSSMFIHGGWMHILGNMWFMHIFANNVEDAFGKGRFLMFYLLCGLIAALAQFVLAPGSEVPVVGASGAIAGVLGAYFILWPGAKILTLVPVLYFITFVHLPAVIVLGSWFIIQLFMGLGSLGGGAATGGVAYGAHVAGFAAGMLLVKIVPLKRRPRHGRRRSF